MKEQGLLLVYKVVLKSTLSCHVLVLKNGLALE